MEKDGRQSWHLLKLGLNNNLFVFRVQGTRTFSNRATEYMDELARRVTGDLHGEDLLRVIWLSGT